MCRSLSCDIPNNKIYDSSLNVFVDGKTIMSHGYGVEQNIVCQRWKLYLFEWPSSNLQCHFGGVAHIGSQTICQNKGYAVDCVQPQTSKVCDVDKNFVDWRGIEGNILLMKRDVC